jgi:hypothetical protein
MPQFTSTSRGEERMSNPIDFKVFRIDDELIITTTRGATLVFRVLKALINRPGASHPSRLVVELDLHGRSPDKVKELFISASKTTAQEGDGVVLELDYAKRYFTIESITPIRKK